MNQRVVRITNHEENVTVKTVTKTTYQNDVIVGVESHSATLQITNGERCWWMSKDRYVPNHMINKKHSISANRHVIWTLN